MFLAKSKTTKVGYVTDQPYDIEDFIYEADSAVNLTDAEYTFVSDLQDRHHVHSSRMIITDAQAREIDRIREKIGFTD
jgi:hypothetical protein